MAIVERDWVMRLVRQLAELLARVLRLIEQGRPDEAAAALEAACPSLLGVDYRPLLLVDSASAAALLGDPRKMAAFAQLLAADARVAAARPDEALARSRRQHALEMLLEARQRGALDESSAGLLVELENAVDPSLLPPRYRAGH